MTIPVTAASAEAQPDFGKDRRVHERFRCRRVVSGFLITGGKENWPVELFDVSRGGFCLRLNRRLPRLQSITVDLQSPAGQFDIRIHARVVRWLELAEGDYRLGCEFLDELSEQELDRLL